jgi:glutathione synthase/RimK-type ligase-like ATP-grasp enzyme
LQRRLRLPDLFDGRWGAVFKRRQRQLKHWLGFNFPILKKWKNARYRSGIDLEVADEVIVSWPGDARPVVGLVKDREFSDVAYWPKFERFLRNNGLEYHFIDMSRSDWLEKVSLVDILVWRPLADPAQLEEAKNNLYAVGKYLGKMTLPRFEDLWLYEEKINQYYALKALGLPVADTFISNNYREVMEYLKTADYPLVWKINTGSSGMGVWLVKDRKQGVRQARRVFRRGLPTYWRYAVQKDYVYLQQFIKGCDADLRVIAAGDSYFGFYRRTPVGDFRASGAELMEKKALPEDALKLAREVQLKLETPYIAIDMLKGGSGGYRIIEASLFTSVWTAEQLKVGGVPGRYRYRDGKFVFEEGKYWMQELMLAQAVMAWARKHSVSV